MTTWIALLRGINVLGHHTLPMKSLAALMGRLGCADVRTYIQSGNVVFRHRQADGTALARRIGGAIAEAHGFQPHVLLLTRGQLERAATANPFPQAEAAHKSLHLFFLARAPERPNLPKLETLKAPTESFRLEDATFYLHAPEGFGRSKLAKGVEGALGVEATARNWRTVATLLEWARAAG